MLENSDQVNNFDQTHQHTLREKNSHSVSHERTCDVKVSSTEEQEHTRYFKVVPEVIKILGSLIANLSYLIDKEYHLYNCTRELVQEKFDILIS